MSVVVAVKKGNKIGVACESRVTDWNTKLDDDNIVDSTKIVEIPQIKTFIGCVGWAVSQLMVSKYFREMADVTNAEILPKFDCPENIYNIHIEMLSTFETEYGILNSEEIQEVKTSKAELLIASPYGIFCLGEDGYSVEYRKYCAIGCGREVALGSLTETYNDKKNSVKDICTRAVKTTILHNQFCGGKVFYHEIEIKKEKKKDG